MASVPLGQRRSASGFAAKAYSIVAWIFVACAIVQVFLAGLGVFAGYPNFITHRDFGYAFGLLTLVLVVLALVARLPRILILGSVLLLVLFALQSLFIAFRTSTPALAALHPVNGFLIILVAIWLARRARDVMQVAR